MLEEEPRIGVRVDDASQAPVLFFLHRTFDVTLCSSVCWLVTPFCDDYCHATGRLSQISEDDTLSVDSSVPWKTARCVQCGCSGCVGWGRVQDSDAEFRVDNVLVTLTRRRDSTGGFVTRTQLLKARRKQQARPSGMGGKTAGMSSGLVYTTDTQNQLVKELLGLTKKEQCYLKGTALDPLLSLLYVALRYFCLLICVICCVVDPD